MTAKVVALFDEKIQLHSWKGWLPYPQSVVDSDHRPGQTGTVIQTVGKLGARTSVEAVRIYDSLLAAREDAKTIEQYQGLDVAVTDPWGRQFPRVRVHAISTMPVACRGTGQGSGGAAARIIITMDLEVLP